jgi:hypothetical protein
MKVVRSKDCGNSPKNQLVENLAVALATGDTATATKLVTDDVEWSIVGAEELHGRDAIVVVLERAGTKGSKLTVAHVLSHGKVGAVNGVVEHKSRVTHFCDMFEFANAKGTSIARITSYRIES